MKTNEPAPEGGRACQHCGGPIPADRPRSGFCSDNCGIKDWKSRNRERSRELSRESARRVKEADPVAAAEKQKAKDAARAKKLKEAAQKKKPIGILSIKKRMLSSARGRARKGGYPFNITIDDIDLPDVCPVLGIPIELGADYAAAGSPSLDKIIPAMGYVKGNVEVISWRANALKRDATVQEMRALADYYEQKLSKNWMVPNE